MARIECQAWTWKRYAPSAQTRPGFLPTRPNNNSQWSCPKQLPFYLLTSTAASILTVALIVPSCHKNAQQSLGRLYKANFPHVLCCEFHGCTSWACKVHHSRRSALTVHCCAVKISAQRSEAAATSASKLWMIGPCPSFINHPKLYRTQVSISGVKHPKHPRLLCWIYHFCQLPSLLMRIIGGMGSWEMSWLAASHSYGIRWITNSFARHLIPKIMHHP